MGHVENHGLCGGSGTWCGPLKGGGCDSSTVIHQDQMTMDGQRNIVIGWTMGDMDEFLQRGF